MLSNDTDFSLPCCFTKKCYRASSRIPEQLSRWTRLSSCLALFENDRILEHNGDDARRELRTRSCTATSSAEETKTMKGNIDDAMVNPVCLSCHCKSRGDLVDATCERCPPSRCPAWPLPTRHFGGRQYFAGTNLRPL